MRILHLLSQKEVTGAETYVETLTREFAKRRHMIFLCSDTLTRKIDGKYFQVKLGERNLRKRILNIKAVSSIVRTENIDIIHAHSRASSWIGYCVEKITGIPLVTSVHGIQPIHISRKLIKGFGRIAIAICENIAIQLRGKIGIREDVIRVIPNGIDIMRFSPRMPKSYIREEMGFSKDEFLILYVGRASGPKGENFFSFVKEVLPGLLKRISIFRFLVVGNFGKEESITLIKFQNEFFDRLIIWMGYKENVEEIMSISDLVIGSGRVALEGMACGKPVLCLGETDCLGILSPENYEIAEKSNFGDCNGGFGFSSFSKMPEDIMSLACNKERRISLGECGRKIIETKFDVCDVATSLENLYSEVILHLRQ